MRYDVRQILYPPILLYCGLILLFTRIKKGELGRRTARGRSMPNKKGWLVLLGGGAFVVGVVALWSSYAHSLGFHDVSALRGSGSAVHSRQISSSRS